MLYYQPRTHLIKWQKCKQIMHYFRDPKMKNLYKTWKDTEFERKNLIAHLISSKKNILSWRTKFYSQKKK